MKDINYVKSILPHRDPFLLVDGIISQSEESLQAFKDILPGDRVFEGHFPDYPIYPGVLIVEGLAQAAGLLLLKDSKSIPLFLGIEKARFKKEVKPGDKLVYNVQISSQRHGIANIAGKATVNNEVVALANLMVGTKKQ